MKTQRLIHDEIVEFITLFPVGLTPSNLAKKLNLKRQTAKSILYRLVEKGKLKANYFGNKGFYGIVARSQNTEDGLGFKTEPKVQNFQLIYENCNLGDEFVYKEHYPSDENQIWNISIRYSKSNNLTILFSGEYGYDFGSIAVLTRHYLNNLNKKYGSDLDIHKLQITMVEEFNDFYKLGLSKNSMFFTDFEGSMLKIYDKGDRLRVEKRLTKRMPFDIIFQNLANPDVLKWGSAITEISNKQDELSKQLTQIAKNIDYYSKKKQVKKDDLDFKSADSLVKSDRK